MDSSAHPGPLQTLILDPQPDQEALLQRLLDSDARFRVLAALPLTDTAIAAATALRPDLVLVDPARDGQLDLRLVHTLVSGVPHGRVVLRTACRDLAAHHTVLLLGAAGYLLKTATPGAPLCDALALIGRTGAFIYAPTLLDAVRQDLWGRALLTAPGVPLDARELAVLQGYADGQCRDTIASHTGWSVRTVQRISTTLQRKLGAHSLFQLGDQASRRRLLERQRDSAWP